MALVGKEEEEQGRRRGPGFGWRLSALAVGIVLVVLVAIARQGMPQPRPPSAFVSLPVATPAERGLTSSTPSSEPDPGQAFPTDEKVVFDPLVEIIGTTGFAVAPSPRASRYADGVPTRIDGNVVYRVNEALNLAVQASDGYSPTVLIGGWYGTPNDIPMDCAAPPTQASCRMAKMADDPLQIDGEGVAIYGVKGVQSGPIVIRGKAHALCAPPIGGRLLYLCLSAIQATEVVWHGDAMTDSRPIGVFELLTSLAFNISDFAPQPFEDSPGCAQSRPSQSYRSATGKVQLVFVFPSTESAQAASSALTGGPPGGTCVSVPRGSHARWVAQDNVLMRVLGGTGPAGAMARTVLSELSNSDGGR
jgi:hypothetical protein